MTVCAYGARAMGLYLQRDENQQNKEGGWKKKLSQCGCAQGAAVGFATPAIGWKREKKKKQARKATWLKPGLVEPMQVAK